MLRVQGRATTGVVGILRSLSAMAEDAITDEVADLNPFKGVRVRAGDPRAKKKPRPIRVFSFEEMHRFAKAAGRYEAMARVFTDTGMRLGEVLPLRREDFDGETLKVRRTAHEGTILEGTKTDHGEQDAGRKVPVPATLAWMLEAQLNLNDPDNDLLFTTPTGRMWRERNFYRDIWKPAQQASGLDIRPHECRHSYVTHLRAAGVNDADLADVLRCEHLVGLREVVVEGELDRDVIADALARWGSDGVSILDADYLEIDQDEIDAAGFTAGVKGGLLTLAAALDASDIAQEVAARIAIVVDRDYDDQLTAQGVLLVTDGHSIENFALSVGGLSRFATLTLGRTPLPVGRDGTSPERRLNCSGEDLYVRMINALAAVSGLRLALRALDPPVGLFDSWLDYFKIAPDGRIESNAPDLLRNVLEKKKRLDEIKQIEEMASREATAATADPLRLIRGRDFVELLGKLLRSSWGRRRGGVPVGTEMARLARMLVFSVDSVVIDSTELMGGLRQRFADSGL